MRNKERKDKAIAKLFARFPSLVERWAKSQEFITYRETPWTPFFKERKDSRIALVTTAGVHLRSQSPFNMDDAEGDPTYREIPATIPVNELTITHNYYDHEDADRDINVVFPIERLRELESEGVIGEITPRHFSLMGHILGRHIATLIEQTGPEVARRLREDGVEAVFLTPA